MRRVTDYDAIYSSEEDEDGMFETKRDAILTEGLEFYRFDSEVDNDIVDADEDGEVEAILNAEPSEEDSDEFFGKKGKKKRKGKKKKRKEKRKTRKEKRKKEARKFLDRQKQNLKNLKKNPLKAIGSGLKEIGRSIKQTSLGVPRAAALGLIRLNYRGMATKMKYMTPQGMEKLKKKWHKLGGMGKSLEKAGNAGQDKKVIMCGSKCRSRLPDLAKNKSNFDGFNQYYSMTGAEEAATMLAAASAIIGSLAAIVKSGMDTAKGGKELKAMNKSMDMMDKQFKAEEGRKSASQRQQEALAEKALMSQLSPEAQIQANPNLTPEEKAAGIKDLRESLGSKIPWKPILIGTSIVAVLVTAFLIYKKTRGK